MRVWLLTIRYFLGTVAVIAAYVVLLQLLTFKQGLCLVLTLSLGGLMGACYHHAKYKVLSKDWEKR